jgi:mannosyltransferase OCH1-like enzyme
MADGFNQLRLVFALIIVVFCLFQATTLGSSKLLGSDYYRSNASLRAMDIPRPIANNGDRERGTPAPQTLIGSSFIASSNQNEITTTMTHLNPQSNRSSFIRSVNNNYNSTSPNASSSSSSIIPANLHFIYVSEGLHLPPNNKSDIPSKVRNNMDDWKMMHPQWQVRIWDNTMVRQEFPELIPVLSKLDAMAWVADILRYHILLRHGGVYIDTDIVPLRSLEPLRKLGTFTVCEAPRRATIPASFNSTTSTNLLIMNGCKIVSNAVIAATKNHPALAHATEVSMQNTWKRIKGKHGGRNGGGNFFILSVSGPHMWSKIVDKQQKHAFNVFYAPTFFPCDWHKKDDCVKSRFENMNYVYGMHMWEQSWFGLK